MCIRFSNTWWTTTMKECMSGNSMDWKLKFIRWCAFFKGKIRISTIIFKQKKYKDSISFFLGQLRFGVKWADNFVGFSGMDLLSRDGNGGLKLVYGYSEIYKLNCWKWISKKSWNAFLTLDQQCFALNYQIWVNTALISIKLNRKSIVFTLSPKLWKTSKRNTKWKSTLWMSFLKKYRKKENDQWCFYFIK